jgi:hypothetical protein
VNAVPKSLHPDVAAQLADLALDSARPLVITDADEVLFHFMAGFERFLESRALYFDWASYSLFGNIRRRADAEPVAMEEARVLVADFFAAHTEALEPVPDAAESLARLSRRGQIIVLSNVPLAQGPARRRALAAGGMDYPLVCNIGSKGAAVRELAARVRAPVFFIDDIPLNHSSVRQAAAHVLCLHFIADRRLAGLLGPAADSDHRAETWPEACAYIEARLDTLGFAAPAA